MLQLSFASWAQEANAAELWDSRLRQLENWTKQGQKDLVLLRLREWKSDLASASCSQRVGWYKFAANYTEAPERNDFLRELRALRSCASATDGYFVHTVLGAEDYQKGRYDSAFYSFSKAFSAAKSQRDTNFMVLGLSNLAALYSELNWKSEALSTALRAYSLALKSQKITETTRLFLNNNVAGLQLDLGYYDRAQRVLEDYRIEELQEGSDEIHVLRAVNYSRIALHEGRGRLKYVEKALAPLAINPSAWVTASSFAVTDSNCTPEVRRYIHDEYLRNWEVLVRDTATVVAFGLPSLGAIAVHQRIEESLRFQAALLRNYAESLPLGEPRRGFRLAMAQMFKLPDYWEEYWRETERLEARDRKYAELQDNILQEFNSQVGLEDSVLRELNTTKILVRSLVGVASVLLASALGLLFWVGRRYRKAQKAHAVLTAEKDRMAKDHMVQEVYLDELKSMVRKSGKTLKTEFVEELLQRMDRDRPSEGLEIPNSLIKSYELTPTEAKVLVQLAYGYRNAEIAQMLNISKSYIHNVRSKRRQKLPLQDNEELEDFAVSLRKTFATPTK